MRQEDGSWLIKVHKLKHPLIGLGYDTYYVHVNGHCSREEAESFALTQAEQYAKLKQMEASYGQRLDR